MNYPSNILINLTILCAASFIFFLLENFETFQSKSLLFKGDSIPTKEVEKMFVIQFVLIFFIA